MLVLPKLNSNPLKLAPQALVLAFLYSVLSAYIPLNNILFFILMNLSDDLIGNFLY